MQPLRALSVAATLVLALSALPAAAQIQRPSGFLDISGTYLYRQFDAHCKQIHPPNDVLRIARVGDVEETPTGAVLHYDGVFEAYRTYWIRNDCGSIDLGMPNCVGLSSPGPSHCELVGQSLAVTATLTYTFSGQLRLISGLIEMSAVDDPSLPSPVPDGRDPYVSVPEIDFVVNLGGDRLALGEVGELVGFFDLEGAHNGPLWLCTCYAHKSEQQVFCCPGESTFEKIGGPNAQIEISGELEGVLRSRLPTLTDTPNEVQFANLQLSLQEDGPVRIQRLGETDEEYEEYLDTRRLRLIKSLTIERNADGTFTFEMPGRFVFDDVPVFYSADRGGREVRAPAFYTVDVLTAHTDEQALDDASQPIPGKVAPVPFVATRDVNLVPRSAPREIELDPADEIEAKQSIINRLRSRCPLNYSDDENVAASWLEQLRLGQIDLTEEVAEGLSRGLWSERMVNAGVPLADELLGISLKGWGKLIGDAFSDLKKFESEQLKDAKKTVKDLEGTAPDQLPPGFNAGGLFGEQQRALADARSIIETAAMTSAMRKTVKALKVPMRSALVSAGVSETTATKLTDLYVLAIDSILTEAERGTIKAGLVPLIKFLIDRLITELKPVLLDNAGLGGGVSYCALTQPSLNAAVTNMQSWPSADQDAYIDDRQAVIGEMSSMNSEATLVTAITAAALEIAAGLSAVQDAADVIANAVKWVAVVKKVAQISKYGSNGLAAVVPIVEVFARIPDYVEAGAYAAFRLPPPFLRADNRIDARTGGYVAALVAHAPSDTAHNTALDAIGDALRVNQIGEAVARLTDDAETGYRALRGAWRLQAEALTLAVAGADAAGLDAVEAGLGGQVDAELFELLALEAEMIDLVRSLLVEVLTARYDSPSNALYVARRNQAIKAVDATIAKVRSVTQSLQSLEFKIGIAGVSFQPAILVESLEAVSNTSGESIISTLPETFTVRAHVRNVSDQPASNVAIELTNTSENAGAIITGPAEKPVAGGSVAADDGVAGSGADEADVEWTFTYGGEPALDAIFLQARVVENGEEPSSFVTAARERILLVDSTLADVDLDGLPDDWETDYGLDTDSDDAGADGDDDGLVNRAELLLGTRPDQADSDGDGRDDGVEYLGSDGFVTDPLDDDTDDDGVNDGADGNPLDGSSQDAPAPVDEPLVSLSTQSVNLTADTPFATINVFNGGVGTLVWTASADEPALVAVTPALPATESGAATLLITTGPGFDPTATGALQTKVRVADVGGAVRDSIEITVTVGEGVDLCGHAVSGSASSPITASEALFTLRAAVRITTCDLCKCDADGSAAVTATDALIILRAAVGQPVTLSCPLC